MGQIIPRGPGKWLIRAFLGSEVKDGKRRKRYTSKTMKGTFRQAQTACAALTTEIDQGSFIPPATQTLREFVTWWLADVAAANVEAGTLKSYRDRVSPLLGHPIGSLKLDRVTTPALQRALTDLATTRGWSRRTVSYTRTVLSMAFGKAVRLGLLRSNPCTEVELPRSAFSNTEDEVRVWDQRQIGTFLAATQDSPWSLAWTLLLTTGVRPGELLALRWEDFDRGTMTLRVQRALKHDGSIGLPKTKHSVRTISLIEDFGKSRIGIYGPLFPDTTIVQLRAAWEREVKAAGLPDIGLYGCRHSHATLLLTLGVPIKVVSERLGHSGVQITMDTYQHVLPHMQEEVAAKLNIALGGAR